MTLRGIVLGCLAMLLLMSFDRPAGECSFKQCSRGTESECTHFAETFGNNNIIKACGAVTTKAVRWLKGLGTSYRKANYLVYFMGLPLLALLGAWLRREPWWLYAAAGVLFGLVVWVGSHYPQADRTPLYEYATEFCVRLGNLTGLTYWGVCFIIFIVGIPGALLWDLGTGIDRRLRPIPPGPEKPG